MKRLSSHVEYSVGDSRCSLTVESRTVRATLDGLPVDIEMVPRPNVVAALTTSAFDKFHLPRPTVDYWGASASIYRYLGLKDARGRVSATAGAYRAIDESFAAVSKESFHRARIIGVFAQLGYQPRIQVGYRWTAKGSHFIKSGELDIGAYLNYLESEAARRSSRPRMSSEDSAQSEKFKQLSKAASLVGGRREGQKLTLHADFANPGWSDLEHFRAAQLLRRAGMLDTSDALLFSAESDRLVHLRDASSGELSLITSTLGIAASINDTSLILIDEPEISLHPEWQSNYLTQLVETFGTYEGCHFIAATHSPLVVSSTPATDGIVVSLEHARDVISSEVDLTGRSTDEVLVEAFGIAGSDNLFIKQSLIEALRLAADRKYEGSRFQSLMAQLLRASAATDFPPAVSEVLTNLQVAVDAARQASHNA